ncbi:MAG TPA: hypothetical protein VM555_07200, partial [Tahibacter sp.]|nr:hypothetical protein [Tahibacter sp.]
MSTTTTFAVVVVGAPNAGCAGVPACHAPNDFSAIVRSSSIEMSPATTSAALFGTKFCFQNAAMSSFESALTEASV